MTSMHLVRLACVAVATSCCTTSVQAQGEMSSGAEFRPDEVREALGNCPKEALHEIWNELDGAEAMAIEEQVLKLCTERSRTINEFIEAQNALDLSLDRMRPADVRGDDEVTRSRDQAKIRSLRTNIRGLEGRIALLEGGDDAEEPDIQAEIASLRESVQRQSEELALLEERYGVASVVESTPDATNGLQGAVQETDPLADEEEPAMEIATEVREPDAATSSRLEEMRRKLDQAFAEAAASLNSSESDPSGASEVDISEAASVEVPDVEREESPRWILLSAIRPAGRPWQASMVRETMWTDRNEVDGETIVTDRTEVGAPVQLTVGDSLPDGRRLVRIDTHGAWLSWPVPDFTDTAIDEAAAADDGRRLIGVTDILGMDLDALGGTPEERSNRRMNMRRFVIALGAQGDEAPLSAEDAESLAVADPGGPWDHIVPILRNIEAAQTVDRTSEIELLPFSDVTAGLPGESEWSFTITPAPTAGEGAFDG